MAVWNWGAIRDWEVASPLHSAPIPNQLHLSTLPDPLPPEWNLSLGLWKTLAQVLGVFSSTGTWVSASQHS